MYMCLYLFTVIDYGCSYWKSALPRQGWMYLSVNHLCFYSYFMGAETIIILRWSSITVSYATLNFAYIEPELL